MAKLSVVIPVYKTPRELLVRMFDSVLKLPQDTEIVCVLDSPGDACGEVLDEYAAKNTRIKVLKNEKNIGETASRNKALEVITGKYFTCVDADDVIEIDAYLEAMALMDKHNLDLCAVGMDGDGKTIAAEYDGEMSFERDDVLRQAEMSSCGIVYRTDHIRGKGIKFPDGLINNGDYVFATRCWWSTDKIAAIKKVGYHIVGHPDSSSRVVYSSKRFLSCAHAGRLVMEVLDGRLLSSRLLKFYLPRLVIGQIGASVFSPGIVNMADKAFSADIQVACNLAVKNYWRWFNPLITLILWRISHNPVWLLKYHKIVSFAFRTGILREDVLSQIKRFVVNRVK